QGRSREKDWNMATRKHRSATVTDGKVDRCFFAIFNFLY
ncbi:hypothetical protein SAMN05216417_1473, partial [Nitrosospira multiformis]